MTSPPLTLKGILRLGCELYADKDFTVYIPAEDFRKSLWHAMHSETESLLQWPNPLDKSTILLERSTVFDLECRFRISDRDFSGRIHAALCFSGTTFSVTFRSLTPPAPRSAGTAVCLYSPSVLDCEWKPRKVLMPETKLAGNDILYQAIFGSSTEKASGLVLITGATGSGKTFCLNALLTMYVESVCVVKPDRRPHVVAIGDPVETRFYERPAEPNTLRQIGDAQRRLIFRPIDYTARTLGVDVVSIEQALTDALRETPNAVVVSELRTPNEFRAALDFAATGHLIFATSHNTSLVDAMAKLIREYAADDTPSQRSALVQRLKAVIHIERFPDGLFLSAFWRATPSGKRNFVSEGLSSILHRAPVKDDGTQGVLGRYWMAKELSSRKYGMTLDKNVFLTALKMDLNGAGKT